MNKKLTFTIFIGLIIITIFFLVKYILFNNRYVTSDAGFVKSDTLTYLSFKLSGQINKLAIHSGDRVQKGKLIVKLSTKELNITLKGIYDSILAMQNKIFSLQASKQKLLTDIRLNEELNNNNLAILRKKILALSFAIDAMKVRVTKNKKDVKRYTTLYKNHKISLEHFEKIQIVYESLKNNILSKQNQLKGLILSKKSLHLKAKIIENQKYEVQSIDKNIESLNDNKLTLVQKGKLIEEKIKDSYIYAPFEGVIAEKFVNNHEVVQAGEKIVAEINLEHTYISVLLEEGKLKNLKVGNKAIVHIDALDKDFKAKISKILPASASTFAIVPRDISSGEFTKLQQRFIVKLHLLHPTKNLRVGMSANVTIRR